MNKQFDQVIFRSGYDINSSVAENDKVYEHFTDIKFHVLLTFVRCD